MGNFVNNFQDIKIKLIISFAVILIIPGIVIGSLSYVTAKDAVEQEMLDGFARSVSILDSTINGTIGTKTHEVNFLSENITSQRYGEDGSIELQKQLNQYVQMHSEVQSIYVGTESGVIFQEPQIPLPPGYDPRERDWYKEPIEKKGEVVVSEPYISAGTDELVVTVSRTTNDHSGVVAVNLSLSHIQGQAKDLRIGEEGYVVLLDENKRYIQHPTQEAEGGILQQILVINYMERRKGSFILSSMVKIESWLLLQMN